MGSIASAATACLIALLLAGCGSSGTGNASAGGAGSTAATLTASTTASTSTTGSLTPRHGGEAQKGEPPPSNRPLPSKARALAFARAVNLTLADLPGFEVQPPREEHQGAAEKKLSVQLARCVGHGHTQKSIASSHAKFQHSVRKVAAVQIESSVSVVSSPSIARAEAQLFRSDRTSACFAEFVRDELGLVAKGGVAVGKVRSTSVSPSGNDSFGWKVVAPIRYHGASLSLYVGIYGFVHGRAEVMLSTFSMFTPIPANATHHLYALLQQRVKSHRL